MQFGLRLMKHHWPPDWQHQAYCEEVAPPSVLSLSPPLGTVCGVDTIVSTLGEQYTKYAAQPQL
jgi:hypothetical protein